MTKDNSIFGLRSLINEPYQHIRVRSIMLDFLVL